MHTVRKFQSMNYKILLNLLTAQARDQGPVPMGWERADAADFHWKRDPA